MFMFILTAAIAIVAFFIGNVFSRKIMSKQVDGNLIIVEDPDDGDYIYAEFSSIDDPRELNDKEILILEVQRRYIQGRI